MLLNVGKRMRMRIRMRENEKNERKPAEESKKTEKM